MYNQDTLDILMKTRTIQKVAIKTRLSQQPSTAAYWRAQSIEARLAMVEQLRREYHGWSDDSQPRLQRVFSIIKRP